MPRRQPQAMRGARSSGPSGRWRTGLWQRGRPARIAPAAHLVGSAARNAAQRRQWRAHGGVLRHRTRRSDHQRQATGAEVAQRVWARPSSSNRWRRSLLLCTARAQRVFNFGKESQGNASMKELVRACVRGGRRLLQPGRTRWPRAVTAPFAQRELRLPMPPCAAPPCLQLGGKGANLAEVRRAPRGVWRCTYCTKRSRQPSLTRARRCTSAWTTLRADVAHRPLGAAGPHHHHHHLRRLPRQWCGTHESQTDRIR